MLHHLVLLKFRSDTTKSQKQAIKEGLDKLPALIPEIKSFYTGFDLVGSERSYDFGLASQFDSLKTLDAYRKHPEHVKVLTLIKKITTDIKAVDFED